MLLLLVCEHYWNILINVNCPDWTTHTSLWNKTDHHSAVDSIPDLYLGGPRFNFQPRGQLSWLRYFVIFLSPCRQILGKYLEYGPLLLLSASFPILHSQPSSNSTEIWYWEPLQKFTDQLNFGQNAVIWTTMKS
jgi:hypothetical protein